MPVDRQRLNILFEKAVEMAPEQLREWLDEHCDGDAELRAGLERLLHADAKAARFLETPLPIVAAAAANTRATSSIQPPRAFGVYRVLRSLGSGGMGEVWLAERSDGEFEQRVAIKQLAYPTPGLLQRFRQERQILARLEHPNIARLIDGGVDATGAPYLAMEYVEGVPITAFARTQVLDLRRRLGLFARVCEVVQYAHQNLIVHRDLKPSNIFVTANGTPKLLDFGIAKVLTTTGDDAQTQTASRLLTPDYAAPEQFSGGAITTAADVYALGVVLYELLADARPPRAVAAGVPHADSEPPPPSAAIVRSTGDSGKRRALRGDLDRITLTALAREPQRRYASAEALAADVRRYLDGRPIAARGDSVGYRARKFVRRNRVGVAAGAAGALALIAATIISLQQARSARHQASLAREHAQRTEVVRQFLVGVFEHAAPDENKGQPITAHQLLENGEQQLLAIGASQPAISADLIALISDLYGDLGDHASAGKLAPRLQAAAADPLIPDEIKARCLYQLGIEEIEKRLFDSGVEHVRRSIALADLAGESGARDASRARRLLARALVKQHDPSAESLLRGMLANDLAQYGERSNEVIGDLLELGVSLDGLSRHDESVTVLQRQLALARAVYGNQHSSVVNGLIALAGTLMSNGDLAGAEAAYREALDTERALLGPDRAEVQAIRSGLLTALEQQGQLANALQERLQMLQALGSAPSDNREDIRALITEFASFDHRELGHFNQAEAAVRAALASEVKVHGSNDGLDSVPALQNLGVILTLQGHYTEAEAGLRHAAAIMLKRTSPSNFELGQMRGELGDVLRREHRYSEAELVLTEAIAALPAPSTKSNNVHPVAAILKAQLSEAQLDDGDAAKAESTAIDALALARNALPKSNYRLGVPLFALARAKLAMGRAADAEPLLREALAVRSPPHPADDPRVLEVKVALVNALIAQDKNDEARSLTAEIEPLLKASTSPYAVDLRARLAARQTNMESF